MSGWRMRELSKKEKILFEYYVLGYCAGLKYVPANWVHKNQVVPFEDIVPDIYREDVRIWKRKKERYAEFYKGFVNGYFKSISSECPIAKMDPQRNKDIYEYLESLWLYHKIYGAAETGT